MRVFLRFYGELNDFLPLAKRNDLIIFEVRQRSSVKDIIESLGIPHTEVDLILINNESQGFDYLLKNEDRIGVYPIFKSLDISSITRLRERPLKFFSRSPIKFIVDVNLGKLAHFLRMLGFDVLFDKSLENDADLAAISSLEGRVLLTRDLAILKRKNVDLGYFVRSHLPKEQVLEVLFRFDLIKQVNLCSRCLECNTPILPIEKIQVLSRLPPKIAESYIKFYICPHCRKVYWEGSHFEHMKKSLEQWKEKLSL